MSELITLRQLAERLGLSYMAIWKQVHSGDLRAVQFSPKGTIYVRPEDVEEWLDSKTVVTK